MPSSNLYGLWKYNESLLINQIFILLLFALTIFKTIFCPMDKPENKYKKPQHDLI